MTSGVIRTGGSAGLLAAGAFVLSAISYQFFEREDVVREAGVYTSRVAAIAGYVGAVLATLGVLRLHGGNQRFGPGGRAAGLATMTGYATFVVIMAIALVQDIERLSAPRIAAAVVVLVGSAVLGVMVLRARRLPWWCGVLLVVAFPLGDVTNEVLFPTAENVLLALLWGSVGAALLSRSRSTSPGSVQPVAARVG